MPRILYPHATHFKQLGRAALALTVHTLTAGIHWLEFGLEVRVRVLGLRDRNFCRNKALVCQPEMPWLGEPPKRSKGRGIKWLALFTQMKEKHCEGCIS
jgi:hypothetical protein